MPSARCPCETVRLEITGKLGAVVYCHRTEPRFAEGPAETPAPTRAGT